MLLIDPPLGFDDWQNANVSARSFQRRFVEYCDEYQKAVLDLPESQILKIMRELCGGLEFCAMGAETLHVVVERELREEDYEPSSKVAKLVVLCALANSLTDGDVELNKKTDAMIALCFGMMPYVLMLAVNDRFDLTTAVEELGREMI